MSAMWSNGIRTDHLIDAFKYGVEDSFKCKNNKNEYKHIIQEYYLQGYNFGALLQSKISENKSG
tara:strand:+ start:1581 stop:1772 length:192 start_codon:yes stop_codon:yes gene_type:complete